MNESVDILLGTFSTLDDSVPIAVAAHESEWRKRWRLEDVR